MGVWRRVCVFSDQGAWVKRKRWLAVALALAAALAALSGATAATTLGARTDGVSGARALQAVAVAQQAPLDALRNALRTTGVGSLALTVRPDARSLTRDLSTTAGVKRYLRSIGVDPAGVVVQRGRRNYAGPNCPGKAWNCTNAHKVIQIVSHADRAGTERTLAGNKDASPGQNKVECTGGTVTNPDPSLPSPGAN